MSTTGYSPSVPVTNGWSPFIPRPGVQIWRITPAGQGTAGTPDKHERVYPTPTVNAVHKEKV